MWFVQSSHNKAHKITCIHTNNAKLFVGSKFLAFPYYGFLEYKKWGVTPPEPLTLAGLGQGLGGPLFVFPNGLLFGKLDH
jgi:hypothetical protein